MSSRTPAAPEGAADVEAFRRGIAPAPLADTHAVSAFLGVAELTMTDWRYKGTGPEYVRIGRHIRYRWIDVEKWVDAQAVARRTA